MKGCSKFLIFFRENYDILTLGFNVFSMHINICKVATKKEEGIFLD